VDGFDEPVQAEPEGKCRGGGAIANGGDGGVGIDGLPDDAIAGQKPHGVPGGLGEEALEFSDGQFRGGGRVHHWNGAECLGDENTLALDVGVADERVDARGHAYAGIPIEAGRGEDNHLGCRERLPGFPGFGKVHRPRLRDVYGRYGGLTGPEYGTQVAAHGFRKVIRFLTLNRSRRDGQAGSLQFCPKRKGGGVPSGTANRDEANDRQEGKEK